MRRARIIFWREGNLVQGKAENAKGELACSLFNASTLEHVSTFVSCATLALRRPA